MWNALRYLTCKQRDYSPNPPLPSAGWRPEGNQEDRTQTETRRTEYGQTGHLDPVRGGEEGRGEEGRVGERGGRRWQEEEEEPEEEKGYQ